MAGRKILYYTWGELTETDCREALDHLGYEVEVWSHPMGNYASDPEFSEDLRRNLREEAPDMVFSFNYVPLLSAGAQEAGIPYYCWVYDSPQLTMQSETLGNACNHVFLFDAALAGLYQSEGFHTVKYLPLACNVSRLQKQAAAYPEGYESELCFLGTLYDDEFNFFDQIGFLPDYIKGYLDGICRAQMEVYGLDLASELMTTQICEEMGKYVKADLGPGFRDCRDELLRNMVRKKETVLERREILKLLGDRFSLDHYASREAKDLPVHYKGYAEYWKQMPRIFARSKINLNITLRSILSGIPLRVIDILGAGGFCLTNYQAELPEYFENGRELVWYESREDLLEKVAYYLSHEEERRQIAAAGQQRILQDFTYEKQLQKMFEME